MFKKYILIWCTLIGALFTACGQSGTTKSGLTYEIVRKGSGPKLDSGTWATINFTQYMMKDTTVLNKRSSHEPMPLEITGAPDDIVMEGLMLAKEGDSITFSFPASKLIPPGQQMPPGLDANATMRFEIGIVKVYTKEAFEAEQKIKFEAIIKAEEDAIVKYAAENALQTQKTASGLHYVITAPGKGPKANPGDQLEVHYTGTLLDGTKFDSSVDRKETFKFPVGERKVIDGWDEGFLLLPEGSKATLLIPSRLAYGERNMGTIKANSILRFDIEFVKNLGTGTPK